MGRGRCLLLGRVSRWCLCPGIVGEGHDAGQGSGATPGGKAGQVVKADVALLASLPVLTPAQTAARSENARLQTLINAVIIAARNLRSTLSASDLPDFTTCTDLLRVDRSYRAAPPQTSKDEGQAKTDQAPASPAGG